MLWDISTPMESYIVIVSMCCIVSAFLDILFIQTFYIQGLTRVFARLIVKPDNIGFYFKPDFMCSDGESADGESDGIPKCEFQRVLLMLIT